MHFPLGTWKRNLISTQYLSNLGYGKPGRQHDFAAIWAVFGAIDPTQL